MCLSQARGDMFGPHPLLPDEQLSRVYSVVAQQEAPISAATFWETDWQSWGAAGPLGFVLNAIDFAAPLDFDGNGRSARFKVTADPGRQEQ